MKYVKMIGLAAAAAMALMAFAAGTASATTLENGTSPYEHPEVIDASLTGSAILETLGGSTLVTCTGGTVEIVEETTGGPNETVKGTVAAGDLTWSGCSATVDTTQGGTLEIHHIANTISGTVTGTTFEVTVNIGTSCTYGLSNDHVTRHVGTLVGDDHNAVMSINTIVVERTEDKFLCPNEARWTANYEVTSPTGLTVTAG